MHVTVRKDESYHKNKATKSYTGLLHVHVVVFEDINK